ncbi:MAG: YbjN domain-containing protein [Pseudomonadota bacterium]
MRLSAITSAATAIMCIASASTAVAQSGGNDSSPIQYFDGQVIRNAMEPKGGTVEERTGNNGSTFYLVNYDGLKMLAVPSSCKPDKTRCIGLGIAVIYRRSDSMSDAEILTEINKFNRSYDFPKAVMNTNGSVSITRYTIADHGSNLGNLRAEFTNLAALAKKYDAQITAATK